MSITKLEKLEKEVVEKSIDLENAKSGNLDLACADRDEIARRIEEEYTAAVRELIEYKNWLNDKEPKPKTRDYIIGYLSESLADADFITPEIIEKMADIFLPLSPKPDFDLSSVSTSPQTKEQKELENLVGMAKNMIRMGRNEMKSEFRPLMEAISVLWDNADHDGLSSITQKVLDEYAKLTDTKEPEEKPAPESEKVLTAAEAWSKREYVHDRSGNCRTGYYVGYDEARENWRLERDLELRELVEKIKVLLVNFKVVGNPDYLLIASCVAEIDISLKNVKPLKAE